MINQHLWVQIRPNHWATSLDSIIFIRSEVGLEEYISFPKLQIGKSNAN